MSCGEPGGTRQAKANVASVTYGKFVGLKGIERLKVPGLCDVVATSRVVEEDRGTRRGHRKNQFAGFLRHRSNWHCVAECGKIVIEWPKRRLPENSRSIACSR